MNSASKQTLVILAAVIFGLVPIYSQEPVFPPDGFAEGWRTKGPAREITAGDLPGYITTGFELYLEFGLTGLRIQEYQYSTETDEISLEAFEMENPDAALGLYLMKCETEFPVPEIDSQIRNSGDRFQIKLVKGNYYVTINNTGGKPAHMEVMIRLANLAMAKIPSMKPSDLFSLLPKESRVENSEKLFRGPYVLGTIYTLGEGDVLLQENKIFGVTAQYIYKNAPPNPDGTPVIFNRLMVRYPNDTSCQRAFAFLKVKLEGDKKVISTGKNELAFEDSRGKFGKVSFKGNTISIDVNLPGPN